MKLKHVSLLLALVMIVSSLSVTAFAAKAEDKPITVNTTRSNFDNASHATYGVNIEPNFEFSDDVIGKKVWQFKTENYYNGNSGGNEPRLYLIEKIDSKNPYLASLGGLDWKNYDFLRISFDIYIGDSDDGIAFRMRRMKTDGTENVADLYIGVGGEKYTTGKTATSATTTKYGYEYIYTSLQVKKYYNVVMNNYRASNTSIYPSYEGAEVVGEVNIDISEIIIDYIQEKKVIKTVENSNYKIKY